MLAFLAAIPTPTKALAAALGVLALVAGFLWFDDSRVASERDQVRAQLALAQAANRAFQDAVARQNAAVAALQGRCQADDEAADRRAHDALTAPPAPPPAANPEEMNRWLNQGQ
jgi:type II secretory pathway pseudopilin PulG